MGAGLTGINGITMAQRFIAQRFIAQGFITVALGFPTLLQRAISGQPQRRLGRWAIAMLVVGLFLGGLTFGRPGLAQSGSSVETLQQQKQRIEQERSRLNQRQNQLRGLEGLAHTELKGLRKTIQATSSEIQTRETQLQAATTRLQTLEKDLESADRTYRQQQSATVARLRFLQRQPARRGWAVLLQSDNMNEFLDRRRQLQRVYTRDRQAIAQFRTTSDRLARQRNQIEQQKNEVALITQQLQAQKLDFEAQAQTQKQTITRLKGDRQALEAAESQLAQDSQNISTLIQQKVGIRSGITFRGTGQFLFPAAGEITSSFGWRMHPILGYERFHSGMDFGSEYGSAIYAAEAGVVVFAGWYGGYGNAVILDHGNGLTTLYAHSSELYVSEGQAVQRGQVVAAVGSSGLSTGPHLHFEVRANGEPVDPAAYL